ncbi:MAG: alpha/beta hydrolase [Planctomycetota bacterium]
MRALLLLAFFLTSVALAQAPENGTFDAVAPAGVIRLWDGAAPGALGDGEHDVPTLTVFLPRPERRTGAAVVVFPGGGYGGLAGHEGQGYAEWLCGYGVTAFVLRYRLGSKGYRHPAMWNDASRAVRLVRARAEEWEVDPARVGVMGSSAGGHLASTIVTHWDRGLADAEDPVERQSSRPDFGILCYPVISMREPLVHRGSRRNLLGDTPDPERIALLSNQDQVDGDTPPMFVWHTADDGAVPVGNAYAFADGLARAGVPHELHVYPQGRHGLGLGARSPAGLRPDALLDWTARCAVWLAGVADERQVEGLSSALVRRAERWCVELPPAPSEISGPLATIGTVRGRIGHVLVVERGAEPVENGAACTWGEGEGRGVVVDSLEGHVLIAVGVRAAPPSPGTEISGVRR